MKTISSAALRHITPKAQVLHLLGALKQEDQANDVLLACLSEAMDLATASKFNERMWVETISRLSGKDADLLPPVEMRKAKCPDIPDASTELSVAQDDVGMRLFDECGRQGMSSVQATLACLMVATVASEACGLTRRAWKEYARKVWELWHADAVQAGGQG